MEHTLNNIKQKGKIQMMTNNNKDMNVMQISVHYNVKIIILRWMENY